MKKDTSLHVKLRYEEAIQSKRDILSSEIKTLMILKAIRNYKILREEEIKRKSELSKKLKNIKLNLKALQTILPPLEMTKTEEEEEKESKKRNSNKKLPEETNNKSLEEQLKEIQEKLLSIQ